MRKQFSEKHSCVIISLKCEVRMRVKHIFVGEIRANFDSCQSDCMIDVKHGEVNRRKIAQNCLQTRSNDTTTPCYVSSTLFSNFDYIYWSKARRLKHMQILT